MADLPKNQSTETNNGRSQSRQGVYKHRDTGATFITHAGEEGILQADALNAPVWKGAWERVDDAPSSSELLKMRKDQQVKDLKAEAAQNKADKAELDAAVASEPAEPSTSESEPEASPEAAPETEADTEAETKK